jgi:hypothetical protein
MLTRRQAIAIAAAGALLVLGGGVAVGTLIAGGDGAPPVARPAPTATAPTSTAGSTPPTLPSPSSTLPSTTTAPVPVGAWSRVPSAPLPPGGSYQAVWTGSGLLVHGPAHDVQGGGRSVGALYDPATRRWTRIPAAPYPYRTIEGGYHAIWTGTELLGWGEGLDGAYNPSTRTWRPLSPGVSAPSVFVWTGRQVLTWGGGCCGADVATGAAYTPSTDTWQSLPAAPLAARHTSGTWTGREMVVVGGAAETGTRYFRDAAAYDPGTRRWRSLPPLPSARTGATVTAAGGRIVVLGGYADDGTGYPRVAADALILDPGARRWRSIHAAAAARTGHVAVRTGNQVFVWGGRAWRNGTWVTLSTGILLDPATGTSRTLPTSPLGARSWSTAVRAGTAVLVWSGLKSGETATLDGALFVPSSPAP